jgi:hypothetical protein
VELGSGYFVSRVNDCAVKRVSNRVPASQKHPNPSSCVFILLLLYSYGGQKQVGDSSSLVGILGVPPPKILYLACLLQLLPKLWAAEEKCGKCYLLFFSMTVVCFLSTRVSFPEVVTVIVRFFISYTVS